mgnify:CR=1 FL=1
MNKPRVETILVLVKMAQEEEGVRLEALLKATKALCRDYVHKERYKVARAERKADVYITPPFAVAQQDEAAPAGNEPTIQRQDDQAEGGAA